MTQLAVEYGGKMRNTVYPNWEVTVSHYYQILSYNVCDASESRKFVSKGLCVCSTVSTVMASAN